MNRKKAAQFLATCEYISHLSGDLKILRHSVRKYLRMMTELKTTGYLKGMTEADHTLLAKYRNHLKKLSNEIKVKKNTYQQLQRGLSVLQGRAKPGQRLEKDKRSFNYMIVPDINR